MNTNISSTGGAQASGVASAARHTNWVDEFESNDPARRWAAACSVARIVAHTDRWADSTALHEAACGAFDAVAANQNLHAFAAAKIGARRALYWERQARHRLVPPATLRRNRWHAQVKAGEPTELILVPDDISDYFYAARPTRRVEPRCTAAHWLGALLVKGGWAWPLPATDAVQDAIEAVVAVGRDRAAAALVNLHGELPNEVADGLVLLVAGSRRRGPRTWPGAIWLEVHCSQDSAITDPGTRVVIAAVVAGRHARPVTAPGAALRDTAHPARWALPTCVAASDLRDVPTLAVAS